MKFATPFVALAIIAFAVPAFAQTAPMPVLPQAPTASTMPTNPGFQAGVGGESGRGQEIHQQVRQCMERQKQTLMPQVHATMQQWRTANPQATQEQRHAERESVVRPLREAAITQCRAQVRATLGH